MLHLFIPVALTIHSVTRTLTGTELDEFTGFYDEGYSKYNWNKGTCILLCQATRVGRFYDELLLLNPLHLANLFVFNTF